MNNATVRDPSVLDDSYSVTEPLRKKESVYVCVRAYVRVCRECAFPRFIFLSLADTHVCVDSFFSIKKELAACRPVELRSFACVLACEKKKNNYARLTVCAFFFVMKRPVVPYQESPAPALAAEK